MTLLMRAGQTDDAMRHGGPPGARSLAGFRLRALDHERSLTALIENEIIPRLVVAHASDGAALPVVAAGLPMVCLADVEALVPLSLEVEADLLLGHVEAVLARGISIDAILVDLLAPAARLLGEYWEDDRIDFVDVTMALWRLQEVVHELCGRRSSLRNGGAGNHRALFASMPGDQHSFGAVVIEELFRSKGWLTDRMTDAETADLLGRVAADWFDMVGLTVSCDCHIGSLGSIIAALRNVSRNPRVCIMVGGRVFLADAALAEQVGADGTARDARVALQLAADLVRAREREAAFCS